MTQEEIYNKLKSISQNHHYHIDQLSEIALWIKNEFTPKTTLKIPYISANLPQENSWRDIRQKYIEEQVFLDKNFSSWLEIKYPNGFKIINTKNKNNE